MRCDATNRLNAFGIAPAREVADWERLHRDLAEVTPLVILPDLAALRLWGPRITRFSFVLSPFATG